MNRKCWAEEEIEYIKENFGKMSIEDIAINLGRTNPSIANKCKRLGLSTKELRSWTKEEVEYLKNNYNIINPNYITEKLNRTYKAIGAKAKELCLVKKVERHGMTNTRIYTIWEGMITRCNPDSKHYRKTTICDEWRNSFTTFYKWSLENNYADNLTIDRVNTYEGYSAGNCRWATYTQQANNRTDNTFIEAFGERKTMAQWVEDPRCKTTMNSIIYRMKNGYSPEESISLPFRGKKSNPKGKARPHNGISSQPLYKKWLAIKYRCYSKKCKQYKDYGGRGIKVCDEWNNSYESFYNWSINNNYQTGLSLDRISVNGDYSPSNCRYVCNEVQSNNKRDNHVIEAFGEKKTCSQWLRDDRCKAKNFCNIVDRIERGWSAEEAIILAPREKRKGA